MRHFPSSLSPPDTGDLRPGTLEDVGARFPFGEQFHPARWVVTHEDQRNTLENKSGDNERMPNFPGSKTHRTGTKCTFRVFKWQNVQQQHRLKSSQQCVFSQSSLLLLSSHPLSWASTGPSKLVPTTRSRSAPPRFTPPSGIPSPSRSSLGTVCTYSFITPSINFIF